MHVQRGGGGGGETTDAVERSTNISGPSQAGDQGLPCPGLAAKTAELHSILEESCALLPIFAIRRSTRLDPVARLPVLACSTAYQLGMNEGHTVCPSISNSCHITR